MKTNKLGVLMNLLVLIVSLSLSANLWATSEQKNDTELPNNTGDVASTRWVPKPGTSWEWQLQNYDNLDIKPDVTVYDIDLFEVSQGGINSPVTKLKSAGKKVVCYFSAGTREDWRPDAEKFSDDALIVDGEMQDWSGEVWLNIADSQVLEENIKPIMIARFDLAKEIGCDGVEPDNVDAYDNPDETHGLISSSDQLEYNKWLANTAHAKGLSVGLKNDVEQLDELVSFFDFAVSEQCFAYDNQCTDYEDNFLAEDKAVFNQEYYSTGQPGEIDVDTFNNTACPYFKQVKISSLWKEGYELDGVGVLRCK